VAAGGAYRNLRSLKGKVKLDLDLKKPRPSQPRQSSHQNLPTTPP